MQFLIYKNIKKKKGRKNEKENFRKKQRNYFNSIGYNYSTKLLVPRNGTNVEECKCIENIENL